MNHPSRMPPSEHLKLMEEVIASPDITVTMHALDAWLIVNACQLTWSHPHLGAELKAHMWELGHRLQEPFAGMPPQMAVLEAGWDRSEDVPHDQPAEETEEQVARIIAGIGEQSADDAPDFGPCCSCRQTGPAVRNLICLPRRAPLADSGGWGCLLCGLPCEGAMAVQCDDCLERSSPLLDVIAGYPEDRKRMPYAGLSPEPFTHDMTKHAKEGGAAVAAALSSEMYDEIPDAWDYPDSDGELGTYICQMCGKESPRPAIVIFAGEGEATTATELCAACVSKHFSVSIS